MGLFEEFLNEAKKKVSDELEGGKWFDKLTDEIESKLDNVTDDDDLRDGGKAALEALISHRDNVINLGLGSLVLFMTHIAVGDNDKAVLEYLRNQASVDELINGMLEDAAAVIQAKKKEEELKEAALEIIKDIGMAGIRYLIPILLSLL